MPSEEGGQGGGGRPHRNKRIFLVAGTSPDPTNGFDTASETLVLAGQREFRAFLDNAGIPHESYEERGGHVFRPDMFTRDLDGIIARLGADQSALPAGSPAKIRVRW